MRFSCRGDRAPAGGRPERRLRRKAATVSEVNLERRNLRRDPSSDDLPDLLTAKDLEILLKIDVKTIYSYVQKGLLPYVKIESNLRFVRAEILDWIEEHRFRPKALGPRK
jgi:predicted DNA-binding transcriptional regulator AlpA